MSINKTMINALFATSMVANVSAAQAEPRLIPITGKPPEPVVDAMFLGVDVGFSKKRPSLGYCVLRLDHGRLTIPSTLGGLPGYGLCKLDDFKSDVLPALLKARVKDRYKSIVLDGPLTPELNTSGVPWYRPQERFLLKKEFPKRIKAQAYNSPVGKILYHSAMDLRYIGEDWGYKYEPFSGIRGGESGLILESFPKLWLAMMFDLNTIDQALENSGAPRSHVDHQMALWLLTGDCPDQMKPACDAFHTRLTAMGATLDPEDPNVQACLRDKDITAALVSALGGMMAYMGQASVFGEEEYGSFLLL